MPVAGAGRNVSGQRESLERGHRDVMRPADAGFEHAAAPNRDVVLTTDAFDLLRLRMAADASKLKVDYSRRAKRNRVLRVFAGTNRFVETDWRSDLFLQRGVIEDVVVS